MRYSKTFKFKKKKKWSHYETWYNRNEKTKLVSYIFQASKNVYYFSISNAKSEYELSYSSLDDNKTYTTLDEAKIGVMEWWHEKF